MRVRDSRGMEYDFEELFRRMDEAIRERLINRKEWDSEQEFLDAYRDEHRKLYGAEFPDPLPGSDLVRPEPCCDGC